VNTPMRPPMPGQQLWYVCKQPGCTWARREPPDRPGVAEALRDLALDYDTHEANEHPESRSSGLTTQLRTVREPHPDT
jgi:hypothetical protein